MSDEPFSPRSGRENKAQGEAEGATLGIAVVITPSP
jgi:hypothetical protein